MINQELTNSGVIQHSQSPIKEIAYTNQERKAVLNSGKIIEADMIIVTLVFSANAELAVNLRLEINDNGQIVNVFTVVTILNF